MRLYGNDMDETTTVLEADLGWIVGWKKDDVHRRRASCSRQKAGRRQRASWSASRCSTAAIARHGHDVYVDGEPRPVSSPAARRRRS